MEYHHACTNMRDFTDYETYLKEWRSALNAKPSTQLLVKLDTLTFSLYLVGQEHSDRYVKFKMRYVNVNLKGRINGIMVLQPWRAIKKKYMLEGE